MRTKSNHSSRKSDAGVKAARSRNGGTQALAARVSKQWRFAPDAIGMFSGPRDLSLRKGMSA